MKKSTIAVSACLAVVAAACIQTKSEVDVKPVAINLNITGRLELVITDARQQEQMITGSKPKRTVRPEDIGLPPAADSGASVRRPSLVAVVLRELRSGVAYAAEDRQSELIRAMAARHPTIRAMLDKGVVGESHDGYLKPRGPLAGTDQSTVDAENANRKELYAIEAAKKKTPVDQVALGYYLARLEHVNRGTWVERYDKASKRWQWFKWDE